MTTIQSPAAGPDRPNSYDLVPYAVYTFEATHPDRLATVAHMCGMKPTPVERCRVLELGCASGGNLIPMAGALPQSTFVGIDLSAKQIAEGNLFVDELQLKNIQLLHQSITDVGPELGTFDYIICHGVYSWVPKNIQDKILAICHDNLSENGVAYVSYNVYPGWGLRSMIRDMMRYHTKNITDTRQQVAQCRALLNFMAESVPPAATAFYEGFLKGEVELIRGVSDSYLFHEHLEEFNQPCYFHEFAERAGGHDLQFLSESEPRSALGRDLKPEVREKLRPLGGTIEREQYLDFLRNRSFRQTLLCRKEINVVRKYDPDLLRGLYISADVKPVAGQTTAPWTFTDSKGNNFTTPSPVARDILSALGVAYPKRILFDDLVKLTEADGGEATLATAGELLFELYLRSVARFFPRQIDFETSVSARPLVWPVARLQARKTDKCANRLHKAVNLTPTAKLLLPLLDGTRGRDQLIEEFERFLDANQVSDAEKLRNLPHDQRRAELGRMLDAALQKIASAALLIG